MDTRSGTSLPRGTEPRQSDASMAANAVREKESAGGAAAAAASGSKASSTNQSITDLVIRDHNLVKKLYQDYQRASSGEEKESIAHRIINEIVQHSGKEEISMYPIMRKKLPNGDSLVDRAAVEHQQVTEDLYRLDQMSLAKFPAQFDQCLSKIMSELTQHIIEEEGELLPALEKVCSRDELVEMGRKFDSTTVTTRPHPWAPREGAAAAAAHAMSKPVDAVRDAIRGDATKEQARDVKEKDEIRSM